MNIFLFLFFSLCFTSLHGQVWQKKGQIQRDHSALVLALTFPSEDDAWIISQEIDQDIYFTGNNQLISKTSDGGLTWDNVTYPHEEPGYLSNVSALNSNSVWVTYNDYTNGPKLFVTKDGGQSWKEQDTKLTVWINFVHFFNVTFGVVMGDPSDNEFEISTSFDGGTSWQPVDPSNIPDALEGEFGYSNSFVVSGNKVWFNTNYNRLFYSANKGNTWDVIVPDVEKELYFIKGGHNNALFAIYIQQDTLNNQFHTLLRSYDDGLTWDDITTADNNWYIYDIAAVPGTNTHIAEFNDGFFTEGNIQTRISYDDCKTWTTIDTVSKIRDLKFFSAAKGYTIENTQFGEIGIDFYEYVGSPLVGLIEHKLLDIDINIKPNPVIDVVNVSFEGTQSHDYIILINDISGHLMYKRTLENISMLDEEINVNTFPSGVYTVTITSKNGAKSLQFVKH